MDLTTERERELIERIAPVLLRGFDDLTSEWEAACCRVSLDRPAADVPGVTREALTNGLVAGRAAQEREAGRLVAAEKPLEEVVMGVLLWEEVILRRLARDAMEDIFSGATALNRFLHGLVIGVAEEHSGALRLGRDEVRRGLEDADRLKSELLSNISHDLKTPLTAIQACAVELLEAPDLPGEQRRRFLEIVLQNSERLSALISRILDVSRIEARAVDLRVGPLELTGVVRRLVDGIAPTASVDLRMPEDLPRVSADAEAVERALLNLIDNAVRFSPDGVPVEVEAVPFPDAVEVCVRDRGPGIPPERQDGLFSKFFQVDASPKGRRAGSGLGLAIVRGLVTAMGGSVGYRPNRPLGSEFWVRLPVADREPA